MKQQPNLQHQETYLNVSHSFSGRAWIRRPYNERMALAISQRYGFSPLLAEIISGRNIQFDKIELYINPSLRHAMPDPYGLLDMEKSVLRVVSAIEKQEKISVLGDYDVDGGTSTALLIRYFRMLSIPLSYHIPDRMKEGYGPNKGAIEKLASLGTKILFTVDCGSLSYDPLSFAFEQGIDVIVLDHHVAEPKLPKAYAIVNPNRLDDIFPHKNLAAVGVTYLFLVALNRQLRLKGFFAHHTEPDLLSLLDLVALGTVCDVMKLKDLNRAFVAQGLKIMHQRQNLGLSLLSDIAGLSERISGYHLGYILGPRINAGGRIGASDLGVRLLTTESGPEAQQIAQKLDFLNKERQEMELSMLADTIEMAEQADPIGPLIVASHHWHPGIIGIVASRLKDKFHRPAIVIALDKEIGKGSGRSVSGFEMGQHVIAAKQAGILLEGGGHAMAAGLTIDASKISRFRGFLKELYPFGEAIQPLEIDASLSAMALNPRLVEEIEQLGPFGAGNPNPRIVVPEMRLLKLDHLAQNTLRMLFKSKQDGHFVNAIAFKAAHTSLGRNLKDAVGKICHIAGQIKLDSFRGGVQFTLEDASLG